MIRANEKAVKQTITTTIVDNGGCYSDHEVWFISAPLAMVQASVDAFNAKRGSRAYVVASGQLELVDCEPMTLDAFKFRYGKTAK